jgi:hypothetical protein
VPELSRVALLVNATDRPGTALYVEAARTTAGPLGVVIEPVEVSSPSEFEKTFFTIKEKGFQGIVLTQDGLFFSSIANVKKLTDFAIDNNLPMIVYAKQMAGAGALLSYAPPASFPKTPRWQGPVRR